MFCRFCGKEIADESRFCRFCGKDLGSETNQVVSETVDAPAQTVKTQENKPKTDLIHAGGRISVAGTVFSGIVLFSLSVFTFTFAIFMTFWLLPLLRYDGMWSSPEGIALRVLTVVIWLLVPLCVLKAVAIVLTRSVSYVNIYEDRVEGVAGANRAPLPIVRRFVFAREDILEVKREHAGLYLFTKTGAKYFVTAKDAESAARVYELLMRSSHRIDD